MALSKEVPEFDIDDEVLLMEAGVAMDSMSNEGFAAPSVRAKSKHSASLKQHKYIDYTRALDATSASHGASSKPSSDAAECLRS